MFAIERKLMRVVLGAVVAVLLAGGAAGQTPPEQQGVNEIKALLAKQVEDWNRRDLEGFMKGYWRSPNLTFFSNTVHTSSWDSTLARYRERYQSQGKEMGTLEFQELKIELLAPTAAFATGRYRLKMASGEASGPFTLILKKMDGEWKIIHDHTSGS
jgi:beta-aspartyl-peptidase (threonine type)